MCCLTFKHWGFLGVFQLRSCALIPSDCRRQLGWAGTTAYLPGSKETRHLPPIIHKNKFKTDLNVQTKTANLLEETPGGYLSDFEVGKNFSDRT